jgi:transcriptional regulator with XRE-family HTH domain
VPSSKSAKAPARAVSGRPGADHVDRQVGARIRERRIMLGLTQQRMAELIGITTLQALKYEKGINRVSAGRLYVIAHALGIEVDFFFEGIAAGQTVEPAPHQRLMLELARNFTSIQSRKHQEALCQLVRTLAYPDATIEVAPDRASRTGV